MNVVPKLQFFTQRCAEVCRGAQGSLSPVDGFHDRCFARLTRTERRLGSTATAGAGASGELSRCGVCM